MPYTYEDKTGGSPYFLDQLKSSSDDVLTEQFAQSFEENPIAAAYRWYSLAEDRRTGKRLTKAEAEARMLDYGVAGQLKIDESGITQNALLTLMSRKKTELRRQEIFSRAKGGLGEGVARFGVALGTSFSDPLGVGLSFVPVVGQARYLKWLSAARSFGGRLAVRAGVGALEGAAGAAAIEPLIYGSRTSEQADYDSVDSLMNVSFGGVLGSTLHSGIGAVRDFGRGIRLNRIRQERAVRDTSLKSAPTPTPVKPKYTVVSEITPEQKAAIAEKYKQSSESGEIGDKAIAVDYLSRVPEDEGFQRFYAVNDKGEVVAGVSIAKNEDGSVYGHHLGSIEPGAGRFLVKHLMGRAEELGISSVELNPRVGSEKFHERMGFKESGVDETGAPLMTHEFPERAQHIERTREAVGQMATGQEVDVTGLNSGLGGAGRAIGENLRNQLWTAYSSGSTVMAGINDPVLLAAKAAGIEPQNRGAFDRFLIDEYGSNGIEGVRQPDPEVAESIKQADEIKDEVPEDPSEAIDEELANAESELRAVEKETEQEPDPEMIEVEEAAKKANDWAKSAEIATACLLRGFE